MLKDCPRCYRILVEEEFEGVRVDACPGCGGIWFDEGELPRLAQAGAGALRRLDDRHTDTGFYTRRSQARCPTCRAPLTEFTLPHAPDVKLDGCQTCRGIWIDEGELADLVTCAARSSPAPPPK